MKAIELLLLIHALATWTMIGIIWFVQGVYSPLYRRLHTSFNEADRRDLRHMGYIIGPIYFFEGLSAIVLAFAMHNLNYHILAVINLSLLVLIWLITWFINLKRKRVDRKTLFVIRLHHVFLTSNWIRTIIWSARGVVVVLMVMLSGVMK